MNVIDIAQIKEGDNVTVELEFVHHGEGNVFSAKDKNGRSFHLYYTSIIKHTPKPFITPNLDVEIPGLTFTKPVGEESITVNFIGEYINAIYKWLIGGAITLAIVIAFQLLYVFLNIKTLKSTGIILGIAAVLIFVSYQLADDTVMNLISYSGPDNVPGTLKFVGTVLIFTYILGVLVIVSILFSAISNLFR